MLPILSGICIILDGIDIPQICVKLIPNPDLGKKRGSYQGGIFQGWIVRNDKKSMTFVNVAEKPRRSTGNSDGGGEGSGERELRCNSKRYYIRSLNRGLDADP